MASQQRVMSARQDALTVPQLFLSSKGADWKGLAAHAYHEPGELDGWVAPAVPEITVIVLTSGAMRMEQRGVNGSWKTLPLRQGDLILRPAGSAANEVRWKSLSSRPMQTLHMHLSTDLFSQVAEEIATHDPAHMTLYGRTGFQDPLLAQIGLALWRELEQPTATGTLYAQTAARMLAVHLLRCYTTRTPQQKGPSHRLTERQIGQVRDFILAHLTQELPLSTLAQQIGYSPYHFARLFRQTLGESPHQFVLRQRIEQAQRLLQKSDVPLAHIAAESGFASQSHLTKAFKQHLGLTPRAYRQDRASSADL